MVLHCPPYAALVVLQPSNTIRASISKSVWGGLEEALGPYDDQRRGWLQELDIPLIDQSISVAMKLMRGRNVSSNNCTLLPRNLHSKNLMFFIMTKFWLHTTVTELRSEHWEGDILRLHKSLHCMRYLLDLTRIQKLQFLSRRVRFHWITKLFPQ